MITTATRGRWLTTHIDMCRKKKNHYKEEIKWMMEMTVLHTQRPYWVRSCQSSVFFWFVQFQTLLQTNYTAVVKQVYGYYTTVYCERSGEQNWVAKKTKKQKHPGSLSSVGTVKPNSIQKTGVLKLGHISFLVRTVVIIKLMTLIHFDLRAQSVHTIYSVTSLTFL